MDPATWQRVKEIFAAALHHEPAQQAAFVDSSSGGDPEVAREVTRLLHFDAAPDSRWERTLPLPGLIASAAEMHALFPGEILAGRYRVDRFLGRGGMGEVWEAEDLELARPLALKTLWSIQELDDRSQQRFHREVELAQRIEHPNVCRVFGVGRHSRQALPELFFLTMELLVGETLASRMSRGPFPNEEVLALARQIARGLDASHQRDVIHRDLKPSNIMLVPDARGLRVVLTDFGLAIARDDETPLKERGILGTPAYLAPEQLEGNEISPATDLYAFGLILYEMLTGRQPYPPTGPISSVLRRLSDPPPPLTEFASAIPPHWNQTVLRCLARRAADRFASALTVVEALESVPESPPPPRRGKSQARTRWLPIARTPLVGRREVVENICDLLRRTTPCLVTLVGAPGVGKTSVAVESARRLTDHFAGNVAFVDLTAVRRKGDVLPAVAAECQLRGFDPSAGIQQFAAFFRRQPWLLVLDNFEHVLDAGAMLPELATACGEVRMLATSRVPLRVSGEWRIDIKGLPLPAKSEPGMDQIAASDSVRLFLNRAEVACGNPVLSPANAIAIRDLVWRLDGIPLAIELTAARVESVDLRSVLAVGSASPGEAREPDEDGWPARHRTVGAAIEWSYGLLDAEGQRLLRAASVFLGGWTPEALLRVARSPDARTVLDRLVDHRLAERGYGKTGRRFRLLETIREFSQQKAAAAFEIGTYREALAQYYLEFAERLDANFSTHTGDHAIDLLEEQVNVDATVEWALKEGRFETVARIGGALYQFWQNMGNFRQAGGWLEDALSHAELIQTRYLGKALCGAGLLAMRQGRFDDARRYCLQGGAILLEEGQQLQLSQAEISLGLIALFAMDIEGCRVHFDEALRIADACGSADERMWAEMYASYARIYGGQVDAGLARMRKVTELTRERNAVWLAATALIGVLHGEVLLGNSVAANAACEEAADILSAIEAPDGYSWIYEGRALIASLDGRPRACAEWFGLAEAAREEFRMPLPPHIDRLYASYRNSSRHALGEAKYRDSWHKGRQSQHDCTGQLLGATIFAER